MFLTVEQIKSIAFGTVDIREEEQGLWFMKCTDAQIAESLIRSPQHGVHSKAASGARLDFYTDSEMLSFDAVGDLRYEVMVDNLFVGQYNVNEYRERGEKIVVELPKGEKRVTLIFPNFGTGAWLKYVELSDGAYIRAHEYKRKIYFYGDSITQGYNGQHSFMTFTHSISRRYDADILVNGVGGWFFNPKYVDPTIDFDPEAVIIACGTNDWNRFQSADEMREYCKGCLDGLGAQFPKAKFFVISPLWRADTQNDRAMGSFELACNIVKEEALAHGFNLIDGFTLVPHIPEFFGDERLHPNDIGFAVYSENLCRVLDKFIK